jgi:hypothetical protein
LALLLFLAPALCLAEPATVIRATELKQAPATDATTVASLAENTAVDAGERKGGWTRVKAGSSEGWVRMLSLRYAGTGDTKQGDAGVTQLLNVARTGTSGTQVTTGVRGLDAEQLANAKPNPAEMKKMEGYAASREGAEGFADKGKLQSQRVDYQ